MKNLRIAHVADTHLGYRSSTIPHRDVDFAKAWVAACRAIVDSKPDLILHAGDVFHRPNPSWGALRDFLDGADILKEAKCPILGISGNHDSSRIMTKHNVFTVMQGVVPHIHLAYDEKPQIHPLAELDAVVVLLSHQTLLSPQLRENLTETLQSMGGQCHNILVAHGDVYNLEAAKEMGGIVIPDFVFDFPWSYVALGHLHMAQPYGPNGWYSGSIERCGWSDYPASPGWTIVTLSELGLKHERRCLPHLDMIQLPDIDGLIEDDIPGAVLRALATISSRFEDERVVVRVKVKELHLYARRSVQFNVNRRVREIYPKLIVQVEVESSLWNRVEDDVPSAGQPIKSIEEMFLDFVAGKTFEDPSISAKLLETGNAALAKAREAESARADT